MRNKLDLFCEVPCLTENSIRLEGKYLLKKWFKSVDKRYINQYLIKFVQYNNEYFQFLGVHPFINGTEHSTTMHFKTTEFVGSIPLRSSDTGKQIGDFVVTPRFIGKNKFIDYIEILNLLNTSVDPIFKNSIPLSSGNNYKPPMYIQAAKFVNIFEKFVRASWKKFNNVELLSKQPTGQINWKKYLNQEFKIEKRLVYPVKKNILNEFHSEYSQLFYVFKLSKVELLSSKTPLEIKNNFISKINFIEDKMYFHLPMKTSHIHITAHDSPLVSKCKELANYILNENKIESIAWKIDFSDVFEKYVQFIFNNISKEIGGKSFNNFKFHTSKRNIFNWGLQHLEPDIILKKNDFMMVIDAKYKSNMYNKFDESKILKEEHRHDLHQLLAYLSFCKTENKSGILCYPSDKIEFDTLSYANSLTQNISKVMILGIPLKKSVIPEIKQIVGNKIIQQI